MNRAILKDNDLTSLFSEIKNLGYSWKEIAHSVGITERSLFDWRSGKTGIPTVSLEKIKHSFPVEIPKPDHYIDDRVTKSITGRMGGIIRNAMHGNPGTKKGRVLGGIRSVRKQLLLKKSPFHRKEVSIPEYSKEYAEFIGILLGDGGLSSRQICITLHKTDDRDYAEYVARLMRNIFRIPLEVRERSSENVNTIVISRTNLVHALRDMGIPVGNKIRSQVQVPKWVQENTDYSKYCARGLFDTDGCFFIDTHTRNGKTYRNPGIAFTSHSKPLLDFFKTTLISFGYAPTETSAHSIFLRKEDNIVRYFSQIGSSNPKHIRKFKLYFSSKYGRVPKRS